MQKAAAYANSRLHAVKAEVVVHFSQIVVSPWLLNASHNPLYFSENDRVLPSSSEADKLKKLIQGCRIRKFPRSGHNLLQVPLLRSF
jgi:hypothetical protein